MLSGNLLAKFKTNVFCFFVSWSVCNIDADGIIKIGLRTGVLIVKLQVRFICFFFWENSTYY